ncbi:hypothetical protein BST83_14385 [Polaribacter filamentus]|jgi:hypothetical protein|uniref:Outer membrane protein beta-barrel domain-containing protein n=1 Tax=Polaribacter filamentus TaxID=53483 RepID=A0A2S7KZZ1_9FLAO|nr:hypothetical protein [Polaribacter filamentus]PQB08191.1 hypothetical protein BST83_14385 [Polaribacter filamentus]
MKNFIISILILGSFSLSAQDKKKSFWETIKGEELETSITFLPVGSHTKDFDFLDVWYTSYNYKSIELAVFKNSYDFFTIALIYKRQIKLIEKLNFIYGFGIMHGYGGRLQDVTGIPFRNTFIFNGEINGTGGISLDYRIAKKISVQLNVSPVVLVYGVRFIL